MVVGLETTFERSIDALELLVRPTTDTRIFGGGMTSDDDELPLNASSTSRSYLRLSPTQNLLFRNRALVLFQGPHLLLLHHLTPML